ncbi:Bromodomain-containing protein [Podospora didyma]|uniref:Bromodomain-containing protein n=1 Tax=Podospora didyma TaxID=330526 RepID=A0AAE0NB34_9PEZI|nr:Bromodomain-containing protein [Podospora didyma]
MVGCIRYGAYFMAHLKDYVKATSPVMHFLTYADNYATGYFAKQGFTEEITLDKPIWMGYIKDYEGSTLMQLSMLPRIRYPEAGPNIRALSKRHIIHQPPQIFPIDPLSIPAIRATAWSPQMDELAWIPRHGPHFNEPRRFLYQIQNHTQAWPFLAPVNRDEVPDYYNVIETPMDLSNMEEKLSHDAYNTTKEFIHDLKLVFSNMEKYMWTLTKEIPEWFDLLEEE